MSAGIYTIEVRRGETFSKRLTWYSDSDESAPIDLTGYEAKLQVRKRETSDLIFEMSTGSDSRISLGGTAGTVDFNISASDTSALPANLLSRYQLELTSPTGEVTRLLEGFFKADQELVK